MISFSIIKTDDIGHSENFYKQTEYALYCSDVTYKLQNKEILLSEKITDYFEINKNKISYLFAGDLTLSFKKEDGCFVSLDAYTNIKKWIGKNLYNPQNCNQGILRMELKNEIDDDYVMYSDKSVFTYDSYKKLLKIGISNKESDEFVQISNNLICGLSSNLLSNIYLLNLQTI
jgi:hypothetical protein